MGHTTLNCKLVLAMLILGLALARTASASTVTIDFDGLSGGDGSPFTSYMEYGFTVTAITNNWLVAQDGGNPGPFIYFLAQPNQVITATIAVTEGGSQFSFNSIDLYSSITTIPYTFTGLLNGNQVFSVSGVVPLTFGNFETVMNPYSADHIDTLDVTLTNSPGSCCRNPMGLDNIVLTPAAATSEPSSLLLLGSGIAALSAVRRKATGKGRGSR